ncbi:MAG: hypothetical protein P8177_07315 [Gemmatimonadota bacterium]
MAPLRILTAIVLLTACQPDREPARSAVESGGAASGNESPDPIGSPDAAARADSAAMPSTSARDDYVSPEDGGPRNWTVVSAGDPVPLRAAPSGTAAAVHSYAPGTVVDNLGCRSEAGGVWCDVQELGGGPRGYLPAGALEPAVSPDGAVARGPDDSALRAGRGEFDTTGQVPCGRASDASLGQGGFSVARAGGGYATVVVDRPGGGPRQAIFFRLGRPIGADTSEADGAGAFYVTRRDDGHNIRIGDERWVIPDAVVLGG